jgi:hypothetical protein
MARSGEVMLPAVPKYADKAESAVFFAVEPASSYSYLPLPSYQLPITTAFLELESHRSWSNPNLFKCEGGALCLKAAQMPVAKSAWYPALSSVFLPSLGTAC